MKFNMITAAVLLAVAAAPAFADSTSSGTNTTTATTTSQAGAVNEGNDQNISFNSPGDTTSRIFQSGHVGQSLEYSGSYKVKNVPSVGGPNLTTSNDTCMGSSSGSANAAGWGVSIGTTWTDANCKMLKNSRELWNMGMKAASLALLCGDKDNAAALEMTGTKCPQNMTAEERRAAFSQVSQAPAPQAAPLAQAPVVPVTQAPVAQQAPKTESVTVSAASGAVVTRKADGSTFVDLRTPR
jgi:hypothetical protein